LPDPAKAAGTEADQALAFADCFRMFYQCISIFESLPFDRLSKLSLQAEPDQIGKTPSPALVAAPGHRAGRSAPFALTRIGAPLMSHGRLLPGIF
jgi:hypothetical protein